MTASADPWAWLGLLKWSLSYSDGTHDSDLSPMSAEDKAFLEKVMKEGIIDENERMKTILREATVTLEYYRQQHQALLNSAAQEVKTESPPLSDEELEELLQELRDIVEQIDYARAFCSLKGLPFLLGCVAETRAVPASIRAACLGILSTLCQNNPPVQDELLQLGALKILSDLYFQETSSSHKAKLMQVISSCVRNHETAEKVFEQLEQANALFLDGLQRPSESLGQRTLFFLKSFVTSDAATRDRVQRFALPIQCVAKTCLDEPVPADIRETGLSLLEQILEQKRSVDPILEYKAELASLGVQRVTTLRQLKGEDREYAQIELDSWENLLVLLARATPDEPEQNANEKEEPLMLK